MRKYRAMYEGVSRTVNASNHIAARSLAERWFFNRCGTTFDKSYLVVIDVEEAGYGENVPIEVESLREAWNAWVQAHPKCSDKCYACGKVLVDGVCPDVRPAPDALRRAKFEGECAAERPVPPHIRAEMLSGPKRETSDPKCSWCPPAHGMVGETTWARIQQEELDKVHAIWSRRAGDAK